MVSQDISCHLDKSGIETDGIELTMSLTDVKIRAAKAEAKSYKLFDGGGLFLLVKTNGSKLWPQKYRHMGKSVFNQSELTGPSACHRRAEIVRPSLLAEGIDPTRHRRTARHQKM